jgi:hypothetical protein
MSADGLDLAVVTGLHRSGTTFLGSVLAAARGARLLGREPLNPQWGVAGVTRWYQRLGEPSGGEPAIDGSAEYQLERLRRGQPVRWVHPGGGGRRLLTSAWHQATVTTVRVRSQVLVVKDPFLSLSLRYVTRRLTDRPVVVAMRHPAAWAMSLARMGWHPGWLLADLLSRPELAEATDRVPRRDWPAAPLVQAAGWTWAVLADALQEQCRDLPAGTVVVLPLESMRMDPVACCLRLVEQVGLPVSAATEARIHDLTEGSDVVPTTGVQHVLSRDTRSSVEAWRSRMAPEDQHVIWSIAGPTAQQYGYKA